MLFGKNFFRKETSSHPVFAKNNEYFKTFDQDRPLSDYDFVVIDTELTGLNQRRDEILAIAGVRISNLRITAAESFHSYTRPEGSAVNRQTLIHRITPQQLEKAPGIKEILPKFVDFCGASPLIGHAVDMDVNFINRAAARSFGGKIRNPCLDTMRMARIYTEKSMTHYYDRYDHVLYDLKSLVERYDLPRFAQHDALCDALQTAYLFLFLVKKLQRFDIVTLKDLFRAGRFGGNIL